MRYQRMTKQQVADLFTAARAAAGVTQQIMAARIGVPVTTLKQYETGRMMPSFDRGIAYLEATGSNPLGRTKSIADKQVQAVARRLIRALNELGIHVEITG